MTWSSGRRELRGQARDCGTCWPRRGGRAGRARHAASAASVVQPSSFGSRQSPSSASRWSSSQSVVEAGALGREDGVAQLGPAGPLDPERRAEAHRHRQARSPYRRTWSTAAPRPASRPRSATRSSPGTTRAADASPFRADPRPVRRARVRADGPADPGRAGGVSAWTALDGALPDGALARRGAGRRRRARVGGLGYNRRAINLHRGAEIVDEHGQRRVPTRSTRSKSKGPN